MIKALIILLLLTGCYHRQTQGGQLPIQAEKVCVRLINVDSTTRAGKYIYLWRDPRDRMDFETYENVYSHEAIGFCHPMLLPK